MAELSATQALTLDGKTLSLAECLQRLKIAGGLADAFRPAVESLIIEKAARERGITIPEDELQTLADEFRAELGLHKAEDTHAWLAEQSLSVDQFEQRIRGDLEREAVRQAVIDKQVEPYFAEHRTQYDSAALSYILVTEEALAEELRMQICEEDADFAELARKHSLDEETREAGGYSGHVDRLDLDPRLQSAVFESSPGEVVGPVKLDDGFCVARIEAVNIAVLTDELREKIADELFEDWIAEQCERAELTFPLFDAIE